MSVLCERHYQLSLHLGQKLLDHDHWLKLFLVQFKSDSVTKHGNCWVPCQLQPGVFEPSRQRVDYRVKWESGVGQWLPERVSIKCAVQNQHDRLDPTRHLRTHALLIYDPQWSYPSWVWPIFGHFHQCMLPKRRHKKGNRHRCTYRN